MSRGDGTGPMGMGAMTGRAAGLCAGFGTPGYSNPMPGRGAMGFGRGWGFLGRGGGGGRRWPGWMGFGGSMGPHENQAAYMKPDPVIEKQNLKSQADALQSELEFIRKRLDQLETGDKIK